MRSVCVSAVLCLLSVCLSVFMLCEMSVMCVVRCMCVRCALRASECVYLSEFLSDFRWYFITEFFIIFCSWIGFDE